MAWSHQKRIEEEYRRRILALLEKYFIFPTEATLEEIVAWLREFAASGELLRDYAMFAANSMVTSVRETGARTWRGAARQAMEGRAIYEALQDEMRTGVGRVARAKVRENANLISSLPLDLAQQATAAIFKAQQRGTRATTIASNLRRKFPQLVRSRAALIARTETSKASTALTQARSDALGLAWYAWRTSEDQRVRVSHRKMQDVLVAWADPPSPEALVGEKNVGRYQAGDIYNCRCYPEPLLRWDQVRWPHKVYTSGQVKWMTLVAFRRLLTLAQLEEVA